MHRWVALTALYEDTLIKIAHEVYSVYKKNKVYDDVLLDECRAMDEMFETGRAHEKELEADLSSVTSKNKVAETLSKYFVRWNVQAYRRSLGDRILEVGHRAVILSGQKVDFIEGRKVIRLCNRANRYLADADAVWDEMVIVHKERRSGGKRRPTSALEWLILSGEKLTRKLLNNHGLRNYLIKMIGYKDTKKGEVEKEYATESKEASDAPNESS